MSTRLLIRWTVPKPSTSPGSTRDVKGMIGWKLKERGSDNLGSTALRGVKDMYVIHFVYLILHILIGICLCSAYNVLVKVKSGDITTPLVLGVFRSSIILSIIDLLFFSDTGSSDMMALTDASQPPTCETSCGKSSSSSSQIEVHHSR